MNCVLEASREQERVKNFILSERARDTHYLCSETATHNGGRKGIRGKIPEDKINWNKITYLIKLIKYWYGKKGK